MQSSSPSIILGERHLNAAVEQFLHHYARCAHDAREGLPLSDRIVSLKELRDLSKAVTTQTNRFLLDLSRLQLSEPMDFIGPVKGPEHRDNTVDHEQPRND